MKTYPAESQTAEAQAIEAQVARDERFGHVKGLMALFAIAMGMAAGCYGMVRFTQAVQSGIHTFILDK